ncbi:CCA tRNA nucleotidyltransferase [Candidatus Omnitrophota bacterium]
MSTELINSLPEKTRDLLQQIGTLADEQKVQAYIVGGIVRDLFLKRDNFDVDIVIEKDAIAFAQSITEALKGQLLRHERFGTATITLSDNSKIDFATARKEAYPQPGALPVVGPGTIKDDLQRRDFTINALAMKINKEAFGALVDHCGGADDINNKLIRVLHDGSFIDDPTRILRAVRFATRFDFPIEDHTDRLIRAAVKSDVFTTISPTRIWRELQYILKEPNTKKYMQAMSHYTLQFLHPGLKFAASATKLFESIEQNVVWFNEKLSNKRTLDTWLIYFLGLLDVLAEKEVREIVEKFQLKDGEKKRIFSYRGVDCRELFRTLLQEGIAPSRVYKELESLSYEVMLFIRAKTFDEKIKKRIDEFLTIHKGTVIEITGDDLKALGAKPGKHFEKILNEILYKKIDGELISKEDEIRLAKVLIKKIR